MQYILIFFLLASGVYLLVTAFMGLPPRQVSRNLHRVEMSRPRLLKRLELTLLQPLLTPASKLIPLSEKTIVLLEAELGRAAIPYAPKEYYARAAILAVLSLPMPFLMSLIGLPVLIPVTALLPFLLFRKFSTEHKDKLKIKRRQIEAALPHFIRSILYRLGDGTEGAVQADIVAIFEDYIKIAPPSLEYDIKLLVTEMKFQSIPRGLHNFEHRLSLPEISFLTRALIGVYQGQPQAGALAALSRDIDVRARETIRRELDKQPGKIKRATLPLVLVGAASLIYVLIYSLLTNSSGLF